MTEKPYKAIFNKRMTRKQFIVSCLTFAISIFPIVEILKRLGEVSAASSVTSVDATSGKLSGDASIVKDSSAIGGEAVEFAKTSTAPTSTSTSKTKTSTGSTTSTSSSGSTSTSHSGTGVAKLQTLQDSFPGTTLNASNWYLEPIAGQGNTPSGSVTISGGILTLSQNTGYTSVNSQNSYDITGSYGFMKLIPDPNSIADQADSGWGIWNSTTAGDGSSGFSNGYEIGVQSGDLYVMVVIGDNAAPFKFSAKYNAATMAFARIRESGGTLYFGYSANGSTWTEPGWNVAWNSSIVDVTKCSVQIYAGNLGSKNAGSAAFADFNKT